MTFVCDVELDLHRCTKLDTEDLMNVYLLRKLRRLNLYNMSLSEKFLSELSRCAS